MNPKEPTLGVGTTLTAQQVMDYLKAHPDFFDHASHVLAEINVPHPQSGQAISLVERQATVLRERIKSMELKLAELLRHGQENDAISASVQRWVRGLFLHADGATLPRFLADSLAQVFSVPLVGIVIWRPMSAMAQQDWATNATADYVEQIDSLRTPVCGPTTISTATRILPEAGRDAQSVAILPLRVGAAPEAFGVLVMGSPDVRRFAPDLGVSFLERISEIASAALSRCIEPHGTGK
ncbi:MAG: DUF484 family protein [Burkholderiaceae bacterium]|nr:DUF484 family protein [Burkholderiaceae bacterium]